ncbi:MAG: type II secretion system F family protein [Patescibacteria group bacterium]
MKYKYQARNKEGELQVGFVDAVSKDSAVDILAAHNLFILSIVSADRESMLDRFSSYFGRVSRKEMVILTRQLAILLEARLPINNALKILYEQTHQPTLKEAVYQIGEDIDAGLSFSQALERQKAIFSNFFISMVRTAEVTGNLNEVVGFLADYTEKEAVLVSKTRSAMIYPAIVISLFGVVAAILLTVVFPQLKPIFETSSVELPFTTRILIGSGDFFAKWWLLFLMAFFVTVVIVADYVKSAEGRALIDEFKIRGPLIGKVYGPVTMTRFANAASILLKGGVPVAQSVEIIGQTIDNVVYQDLFREISQDVRQGMPLSEAIMKHPDFFPALVPQMIVVGEQTGQLDTIFTRISNFYNREADSVINNIVDLIQPVLMIVIGLMVGLLFGAVLVPLYRLTSTFGG